MTGQPLGNDIANNLERPVVERLADRFAGVLKEWLSKNEFAEMVRLNKTDPTYAKDCCASHNYCDSNMAMDAAWNTVLGRSICMEDGTPQADADVDMWNATWELARKNHIGFQ